MHRWAPIVVLFLGIALLLSGVAGSLASTSQVQQTPIEWRIPHQPPPTLRPSPIKECDHSPLISSFTADPNTIATGSSVVLGWDQIINADGIEINQGVGKVEPTGSIVVSPSRTTTYTIVAYCGSKKTIRQVTVTVGTGCEPKYAYISAPQWMAQEGSDILRTIYLERSSNQCEIHVQLLTSTFTKDPQNEIIEKASSDQEMEFHWNISPNTSVSPQKIEVQITSPQLAYRGFGTINMNVGNALGIPLREWTLLVGIGAVIAVLSQLFQIFERWQKRKKPHHDFDD